MNIFARSFIAIALLAPLICGAIRYQKKCSRKQARASLGVEYLATSSRQILSTPKPLSEELSDPLNQKYYYLGKGRQSSAFASVDGRYVLKLIKWPKKKKKRKALVSSLLIAMQELKDEAGLLAIQYGPSISPATSNPTVEALDRRGRISHIDLRRSLFALQIRAPLSLKETLFRLQAEGARERAAWLLRAFFQLLQSCRDKGIIDLDGSLIRNGNIAFVPDAGAGYRAISIDIGKYAKASYDGITAHDIKRLKPLASWIKQAWPELLDEYERLFLLYTKTEKSNTII